MRKSKKSFNHEIKLAALCITVSLTGCEVETSLDSDSSNLLYATGYESDVAVLPMKTPLDTLRSAQDITNSDDTGYSWAAHLPSKA